MYTTNQVKKKEREKKRREVNAHSGSDGMSSKYTLSITGSGGMSSDCTSWIRMNEQHMYTLDQME